MREGKAGFGTTSYINTLGFVPSVIGTVRRLKSRELINYLPVKELLWLLCGNRL